jgi:hypothetical protein
VNVGSSVCSGCGTSLPPFVESDGTVRCGACGTVNRPGGPAGFGIPPGGYSGYGGASAGAPGGGRVVIIVIAVIAAVVVLLMLLGAGAAFFLARRATPTPVAIGGGGSTGGGSGPVATSIPARADSWEGVHGIVFADANGDGVPDVVGRLREAGGADRISLGAFDAATGRKLWESAPLGTYHDTFQGLLGFEQDTLVLCGATGKTSGVGLRDGKTRWSGTLPEKATALCKGDRPGEVRVVLADASSVVLRLADGRTSAPAPRSGGCARIPNDEKDGDPGYETRSMMTVEANGMTARVALQRPGGPEILLGYRSKGTSVPMIAAVFADPLRSWKSDMPGTNPLETGTSMSQEGVVTASRACADYGFSSMVKPHMVVCFDLAGHRLWETALLDTAPISAIQSDDRRVFVSQWGRLTVLDAARGTHLYSIGRP